MRALRITAGIVLGYVLSLAVSLGWFYFTHGDPIAWPTRTYLLLTAAWCVLEGVMVGSISAAIGGSRKSSFGVAITIVLVSVLAWLESHQPRPVWSLDLAMLVLAPATALGYLLPLPGTRKVGA